MRYIFNILSYHFIIYKNSLFFSFTESKTILKESLNISEYQSKLIKKMMLTFYWILALLITGTEVRGINLPGKKSALVSFGGCNAC